LVICTGIVYGRDKKHGLFFSAGMGYGIVTKPWSNISDSGINLKFQAGFGISRRIKLIVEYELHHFLYEIPNCLEIDAERLWSGDWEKNWRQFKTIFIHISCQFFVYKDFFIRAGFGPSYRYYYVYVWPEWPFPSPPPVCTDVRVEREFRPLSVGISAGYEINITQYLGVTLEAVTRSIVDLGVFEEDAGQPHRVLGIYIIGTWYLK
jgi:hypothetical protein